MLAPAKINLALHVTGQRPDGYHLLDSIVVFAEHGDIVRVTDAEQDRVTFAGSFGASLDPCKNSLIDARDALRTLACRREVSCPPVHLHLEKHLPVASGVGGGSADAAATLRALNQHWQLGVSDEDLADIALPLGADIPVCLSGNASRMTGIGEGVEKIRTPPFNLLLVNPGIEVSTPSVFRALTEKSNPALSGLPENIDQSRWIGWLAEQRNDLQQAAISVQPVIGSVLEEISQSQGCELVRMSGSGATCFGLYESEKAVHTARSRLELAHPDWWIIGTRTKKIGDSNAD